MHHLNRNFPSQLFIAPQSGGGISFTLSSTNAVWQHTHVSFKSNCHKNHCKFFVFIHWIANTNLYASLQSKSFSSHLFTAPPSGGLILLYSINRSLARLLFPQHSPPSCITDLQARACSKFRKGHI